MEQPAGHELIFLDFSGGVLTDDCGGRNLTVMENSFTPSHKHLDVLAALMREGPMTSFEMEGHPEEDRRHWGPTFSTLLTAGMTEHTGKRRPTGLGGLAFEHRITPDGANLLASNVLESGS